MINKSRFSYKIVLTVLSGFFILFAFSSLLTYFMFHNIISARLDNDLVKTVWGIKTLVETSIEFSSRSYMRSLAEQTVRHIDKIYKSSEEDGLWGRYAREEAASYIKDIKIADSGYAYIVNSHGIVEKHPHPEVIGADVSSHEFVRKQMAMKSGFLRYEWKNPDDNVPRRKVLYMEYYKPWDWILSFTAYEQEVSQLIQPGEFNDLMKTNRIGENGYPFLIDNSGSIVAHPFAESSSELEIAENADLLKLVSERKSGKTTFTDMDPVTGEERARLIVFEKIDNTDWVIVGTALVDEYSQPLEALNRLFIALIFIGFILSVLISLYLSRSVSLPIHKLLEHIQEKSKKFDMNIVSSVGKNEIEELSDYFKEYVRQINDKNRHLQVLLEEQTAAAEALNIYKEVFDNIAEGIAITETNGDIVTVNSAFEKITGYHKDEVLHRNPKILKSDRHSIEFYEEMWRVIQEEGFWSGEIWNKRKSGEEYPEWLTISAVKNSDGVVVNYASSFSDITEVVKQKEHISFIAYHDILTGLPNRLMLLDRMNQLISECRRKAVQFACIAFDPDNFKTINDSIGQQQGDQLLKLLTERIGPVVRVEDVFARVGGDEFCLLIKLEEGVVDEVNGIVERLFRCFADPFYIDEHIIYITLSLGVAVYPDDGEDGEELLNRAMMALNNNVDRKGNSYRYYSPDIEQEINRKIVYLAKIREGLQKGEFEPFFQPKIDYNTGRFSGAEALARWVADDGIVSPAYFIPVAEDSGLIVEMSWQIYKKAFEQFVSIIEQFGNVRLSVNISPMQLQLEGFLETLLQIQQESGLGVEYIDLEITESMLVHDFKHVKSLCDEMAQTGFTLSIDDFGTGYSSLKYLKELPFSTLKIDQSFVAGIRKDKNDERIVTIISLLAKQFDMKIVAEGVETKSQEDFLRQLGCNYGQGYFYGKPMDYAALLEWIPSHQQGFNPSAIASK